MKTKAELKKAREDAKQEVKMWIANDWDLKEETPEYFLMTKNTSTLGGHVLVALFTAWWTFGVANLVYWLLSRKKKKILK